MTYQETKIDDGTRFKFAYFCEDLFGKARIRSVYKLKGEILDEILFDMIMAKKIKKGHTESIEFTAEFRDPWEEEKKEDLINNDISMKKSKKVRVTTAILAFFLGGWGVHKFYLGQTGLGFVYLIFCWTLIPAFIAFIEFIIFLTMTDEAFDEKYN